MRPTGRLHLGHLVGALRNWVPMQDQYDCSYFVADWHALTSEYGATDDIAGYGYSNVADWIAAGLDPDKSTIFVQSLVPEHAELHLLLSMIIPVPWLERVPTYKEQRDQLTEKDLSTYGFLGYPLLQTADIIMYNAHYVPVGEDQVPHLELSREVVRRFHAFYGEVFVEPQPLLTRFPRLPGPRQPQDEQELRQRHRPGRRRRDGAEEGDVDVHRPGAHPGRHPGQRRGQPGLHLP